MGNVNICHHSQDRRDRGVGLRLRLRGGRAADDSIWEKPSLEIIPVAPKEFEVGEAFAGPIGAGYKHRLVWSFGFQRKGDDGQWELLVDAQTGEVLAFEDKNLYEKKKITGGVYPLTDTGICTANDTCGSMFPDYPMPFADTGLASPNNFTNSAGLVELHERDGDDPPVGQVRHDHGLLRRDQRIGPRGHPPGRSERPARLHDHGLVGG